MKTRKYKTIKRGGVKNKTRKYRTIKRGGVKNKTRRYRTIKRGGVKNKTRRYRTIKRGGAPSESLMWVILDGDLFIDPITNELYLDPVITADGQTYERVTIERWLRNHNTSPATGKVLANKELIPSYKVKEIVDQYRAAMVVAEGKGELPTVAEWETQEAKVESTRRVAKVEAVERERQREIEHEAAMPLEEEESEDEWLREDQAWAEEWGAGRAAARAERTAERTVEHAAASARDRSGQIWRARARGGEGSRADERRARSYTSG